MALQISQTCPPPGLIDLGLGNPDFSLLPLDLLGECAAACFGRGKPDFLQYGLEEGNGYFRQALADFLSQGYGFPVSAESLFITHGASGALDLACTLFTHPGDTIFAEEPSYFLALKIFRDHGLQIVPIPTDGDGLVVESLEEKLAERQPKFVYTIPTFQNPSGQTLSAARRERLVRLARQYNFLVVADEVYHFLDYTCKPPVPLAAQAADGNVLAVNSFSKTLAPGLRLGWIQSDAATLRQLTVCGLLDSGGGLNPLASALVRELLERNQLTENIQKLRGVYQSRARRMEAALQSHLPGAEFRTPEGGFFFWVRLPGVDTAALREKARARQVDIRPGLLFSSQGGLDEYMRLGFAYYGEEEIEEGVKRLAECL